MSLFQTRRPGDGTITVTRNADPVPEGKFSLGPIWRGHRYAKRKDGNRGEYAIALGRIEQDAGYVLRPGELLVSMKRDIVIDGSPWDEIEHHLAFPVPTGTLADVEAKVQASEARRTGSDRPLRTWSAIGDLFRKVGSEAAPIVLGKLPEDPSMGAMQAATGVGGPLLLELEAKTVDTSPAGLVKYFTERGIELTRGKRDATRLVARSRLQLSDYDRTLLHRVEPLLVAELGGPKVLCTECDQPAVTPIEPRAWACKEHAQ